MYTLKDLLSGCSSIKATSDSGGNGVNNNPTTTTATTTTTTKLQDYTNVWRGMMRCIEQSLHTGRGVAVPNFGRFTVIKNSVREAPG